MKIFYNNILKYTLLVCLLFSFSNTNKSKADNGDGITGRFINVTFLEKIADNIAGTVSVYCVEINFNGSDSAEIFNGFEEYKLSYKKEGDDYILQKAVQDKDIPFMFINDSTILLIDTMWTGSPGMSVFYKVTDGFVNKSNKKWWIDYFINERVIAGNYLSNDQNQLGKQLISFKADGSVTGLENYATYFICYSGDCVGETEPVSNLITFKSITGEEASYAFESNKENNTLKIYNIAPPVKDIKGERAILDLAFDLRKQ